jgi:hypothetical protein
MYDSAIFKTTHVHGTQMGQEHTGKSNLGLYFVLQGTTPT